MSAAWRLPRPRVRVVAVALLCLGAAVLLALLGFGPGADRAGAATSAPPAPVTAAAVTAAAVTSPAAVSVSITDNQPSARSGDALTYQAIVTNSGAKDIQLLLEISVPAGAEVIDAGGGTIRQTLIDYGITALARAHVAEKFTITVGRLATDQKRIATVASVYVLDGSNGGAAPDVVATDSDAIGGSAGAHAAAGVANEAGPAASASRASGPAHQGFWITALVLGALLVIGGVALAAWREADPGAGAGTAVRTAVRTGTATGSGGRRHRSARPRPGHLHAAGPGGRVAANHIPPAPDSYGQQRNAAGSFAPQPGGYLPRSGSFTPKPGGYAPASAALSHPGRAARRAAQAAADAGIRTGAHQAGRPLR
jgi:hypothetical protein